MAITKIIGPIHPPSSGGKHKVLKNTIEYILKSEKTENGRLVGSIGCFPETALRTMIETQQRYEWASRKFGNNERLGYHLTISFSPEEKVSPEVALQVMKEFSECFLGNQYEAVYSVHTDTEHLHGHLCFNSVNFETGRKFRYEKEDWAKIIQPITDSICQKYGLHTLEMDTGKTLVEYEKEQEELEKKSYFNKLKRKEDNYLKKHGYHKDSQTKYSWNDHLRLLLDDIILHSNSMEEFYRQLRESGFSVKQGKYLSLKAPGMEIYRRTHRLGEEYTLENIEKRILIANKPLPEYQIPENCRLILPIRQYVRIKQRRTLSPEMRRYFRRLYQMGIRPRSARLTYQDVRETRNKAEELQRQLEMVLQYHIGSKEAAMNVVKECREKCVEEYEKLNQVKQKHSEYDLVVKKYRWYIKMQKISEQSMGTDAAVEEKLEKARLAFEKYGFTEEAMEKYLQSRKKEIKAAQKKLQTMQTQLRTAESIAKEFGEEAEVPELDAEMEQFYESIPDKEETIEERKYRRERSIL